MVMALGGANAPTPDTELGPSTRDSLSVVPHTVPTHPMKGFYLLLAFKALRLGTSLAVQWLGLHAFTARGLGSIPGRGTRISQITRRSQKKKWGTLLFHTKQNHFVFENELCFPT